MRRLLLPGRSRRARHSRRARRPARRLAALAAVAVALVASTSACVRYEPSAGAVALTFDDGPHPTWTPQVLDLLDRLRVKATFFVVGDNVDRYPELVADIVRRGHSVQNHSYSHADLLTLNDAAVTSEITRTSAAIERVGAPRPNCLRPPYGSYDSRIRTLAANQGLQLTLWDVDPRDWARPGTDTIVARALEADGGDVVLFHDGGGDRSQTVAALPRVILELRQRGLTFEPLCVPA